MDKYNQQWVMLLAHEGANVWAITLDQTVFYSCPEFIVSASWRRHEEKHKEQWKREGRLKFVVKYLWYSVRYGYRDNPLEIEARAAEKL